LGIKYIIGIDIGTTNIKGSLYSSTGDLIVSYSTAYGSSCPKESYHEQNPNDWVNGFLYVLENLLISDDVKENLEAISLSTQGGTVIPVDKNFKPLCNAITWLDRRGVEALSQNRKLGAKNIEFYNKTGWRLDSNISFMPLWWLRENKNEVFNKIYRVLYVNDYVLKKITGNSCQDPSNASITLFYNVEAGKWDKNILNLLNFAESKFSEVKNPGELVGYLDKKICSKLGIKNKVKIINGSHDQFCAGVGAGILDESEILLATGTAWVIFKMLNKPLLDSKRFFAIERFSIKKNNIKNKFGLIYAIPAAGASLRWFATGVMNLENEKKLFKLMDDNIEKLKEIKNNIVFYPYLTGAFGPDFDTEKKASFLNMEIGHNYLDLIKAIMEGIGFQLKKILVVLAEKGIKPQSIKMTGGGAKSKIWPQIIADITNLNILVPENRDEDFATKGAAIIAGYGAGIFSSLEEGYGRLKSEFKVIKPNPENIEFYDNKFRLFLQH